MNKWTFLLILVFIIVFEIPSTQSQASNIYADGADDCADFWFKYTVTIDQNSLPIGVKTISAALTPAATETYLINSTDIPLIISPPDPRKKYSQEPWPGPTKLVSGKGYGCDVMSVPMKCDSESDINNVMAASFRIPEINQAIYSKQVRKDDRPQNAEVPPPQNFQFWALYGDKKIEIRGTVTFSLNEKYNPNATKQGCSRA